MNNILLDEVKTMIHCQLRQMTELKIKLHKDTINGAVAIAENSSIRRLENH